MALLFESDGILMQVPMPKYTGVIGITRRKSILTSCILFITMLQSAQRQVQSIFYMIMHQLIIEPFGGTSCKNFAKTRPITPILFPEVFA